MDKYNWRKVKRSSSFRKKVQKIYLELTAPRNKNIIEANIGRSQSKISTSADNQADVSSSDNISAFTELSNSNFTQNHSNENMEGLFSVSNSTNTYNHDYLNVGDDDSVDDEDDENELIDNELKKDEVFRSDLKKWAITFNITQQALKVLLQICNERNPNLLPKDPRTLLQTPTVTAMQPIGLAGKYWHQGLSFCLQKCFADVNESSEISININIDGLPIFPNSSRDEFWPILFNIHEQPDIQPMVIGIYLGTGKPSNLDLFLRPFVDEAKKVLTNGVLVNSQHKLTVKIRAFICDSPARAFVKGVSNFNSQNGCQKCTTVGEYSYLSHSNIFPRTECSKRTDKEFRERIYDLHHKVWTPLEELPGLNMVDDFPVADSLHLIDLGVMKKLLIGWRDGKFNNYRTKWSARECDCISKSLKNIKMVSELHRAVRGLDCLAHWKALEYRTFLYYIGIVLLKDRLPQDVYQHFLLFFCATTICSSTAYSKNLDLAQNMYLHFIEYFRDIYGEEHINSNIHNLSHLVDDVKKFGILPTFSAYPFESKLCSIKRMLRTGNNPLAQAARRLTEFSNLQIKDNEYLKNKLPTTKKNIFRHINGFILNPKEQDKWFLTTENKLVCLKNVTQTGNVTSIFGASLKNQNVFFDTPIISSFFNIYSSDCKENSPRMYSLKDIKCKMVSVKYNENSTVFIPLLHTIKY